MLQRYLPDSWSKWLVVLAIMTAALAACEEEQGGVPDTADAQDTFAPLPDISDSGSGTDLSLDIADASDLSVELVVPPSDWDWSRIRNLQVNVSSESVEAGESVRASCVGVDEQGIARDLTALEIVWQWDDLDGITPLEGEANWQLTKSGPAVLQCQTLLPDGRELTGSAFIEVLPSTFSSLVPVAPESVRAGDTFSAYCSSADRYGNPIEPSAAEIRFDVEGAADAIEPGIWRIARIGDYTLTCFSEAAIPALPWLLRVSVSSPVRMQARLLPEPALGVYTLGQFVRSSPLFFDEFGNQALLVDTAGTLETVFDQELTILPTGFRFEEEGLYSLTQTWTSPEGLRLQATIDGIVVNSFGPESGCVSPPEYETLTDIDSPFVPLVVEASDMFGVPGISASGLDMTRQTSGEFLVDWPVRSGLNFPVILAVDGEGRAQFSYCPFTVADGEQEIDEFTPSISLAMDGANTSSALALLSSTLPTQPPEPLATNLLQRVCSLEEPASCNDLLFPVGTPVQATNAELKLHVASGILYRTWTAEALRVSNPEQMLAAQNLQIVCPVVPGLADGRVTVTSQPELCTCTTSEILSGPSVEELTATADSLSPEACSALVASIPSQDGDVAELLQRVDPLGSAATMQRVVSSTRFSGDLTFSWQWRRSDIIVGDSTLILQYETRPDAPSGAEVLSNGIPVYELPSAGSSTGSAVWVGQSLLEQTSESFWQSRFLDGWFWNAMESLDLRNSPEIGILLPLVQMRIEQALAWSFDGTLVGITGYDFIVPNVEALLGIDYDAALSFNFFTRLQTVDGAWQSTAIWRDAAVIESVRYPLQPFDMRAYDLAFESFDAVVRDTIFQDQLPDAPAPVLRDAAGDVIAEFVIGDQPVVWSDGATRLTGTWRLLP